VCVSCVAQKGEGEEEQHRFACARYPSLFLYLFFFDLLLLDKSSDRDSNRACRLQGRHDPVDRHALRLNTPPPPYARASNPLPLLPHRRTYFF
jgi:hypothetical protein